MPPILRLLFASIPDNFYALHATVYTLIHVEEPTQEAQASPQEENPPELASSRPPAIGRQGVRLLPARTRCRSARGRKERR